MSSWGDEMKPVLDVVDKALKSAGKI